MVGSPYLSKSFERELLAERTLEEFSNQSMVSILSSPMRSPVKFTKTEYSREEIDEVHSELANYIHDHIYE